MSPKGSSKNQEYKSLQIAQRATLARASSYIMRPAGLSGSEATGGSGRSRVDVSKDCLEMSVKSSTGFSGRV